MGRKPETFKRLEGLLKRVLAVPKEEIDKREREWKDKRKLKVRSKKR